MRSMLFLCGSWLLMICCASCINCDSNFSTVSCAGMAFFNDTVVDFNHHMVPDGSLDAKKVIINNMKVLSYPEKQIQEIFDDPFLTKDYRLVRFLFTNNPKNMINKYKKFFHKNKWREMRKMLPSAEQFYCYEDDAQWLRVYEKNGALVRVCVINHYCVSQDDLPPNNIHLVHLVEFSFIDASPSAILGTDYTTLKSDFISKNRGHILYR